MNRFQQQELRGLKENTPSIEVVYAAIQSYKTTQDKLSRDILFRYFYPLSLGKAWEFFPSKPGYDNDELARNAALDNIERWLADVTKYDQDVAKISPYFNTVTNRNFKNFLTTHESKEPDIFYGYEEEQVDDHTGSEDAATFVASESFHDEYDYPTRGVTLDDPETLAINQEQHEELLARMREVLYPGDMAVLSLLLEKYDSAEIASILERTEVAVENALRRIRAELGTVNRG